MFFAVSPQLIKEAQELAIELVQSGHKKMEIRSTDFYVTVEPENKPVIHKFECEGVSCYITMGR